MSKIVMDNSSLSSMTIDDQLRQLPNWSSKIRFLHSKNFSKSAISKILSTPEKHVSFQWVRNVLNQKYNGN